MASRCRSSGRAAQVGVLGFRALWQTRRLGPVILLLYARRERVVQLFRASFEELERTGDRHQAVRNSMDELFLPGDRILADAAGIRCSASPPSRS
jgi:hypothetical protein